ncbi:MAG TPA: phosphate/phosphite/phosphonate ABC transporter substrate-binding protein [Candidatus Binatia bacterium]|nr:phosphate/phosphite/phosphonate ABC transporter substrate-binding protein [Candidatus Binatia bacterium]
MAVTPRAPCLVALSAIFLLGVVLSSTAPAQAAAKSEPKAITLGIVAEINQKEIERHFQNFIGYVAAKLSGSASPVQGKIVMAQTESRLANLLRERRADFYMESPHPTHMINNVYGAGRLILRRWKGGMADYHAAIFTTKNGEIKRLEDLKGKLVAFEDPESTSGYFLPKLYLTKKGFRLSRKAKMDAKVSRDEVGYIFAQSQDKLVGLVLANKVAAGAFSNDDFATLDPGKKSEIIILAETASLPRHLVSVRKDLPPGLAQALEKILLSMHQDAEGRSILQKADGTTKFDPLPGGELAMRQRLLDTYYSPQKK